MRRTTLCGLGVLIPTLTTTAFVSTTVNATPPGDEPAWSIVITTAPQFPQDVWVAGLGNNTDGWLGGGSICFTLAQGFEPGDNAVALTTITSAGVLGVDGMPVEEGTYTASSEEFGELTFDVVAGETFFVILDAFIITSNVPFLPEGETLELMFTFEFLEGNQVQTLVAWQNSPDGFFPFLNEGPMKTNVRQLP